MKLLITTQAVDREDPILGFFHGWIFEFAKHFSEVHVICLRKGEYSLPSHVHVHSLGKECGVNRIQYVVRFLRYIVAYRKGYDAVFSHMNPHYILLGGLIWRLTNKPIFFWRNHAKMNVMTRIAAVFARRVFYTSPYACTRIFAHARQMPVGIDTTLFKAQESLHRRKGSVLFLGRLSPVKRPELFIDAVKKLSSCEVRVYGDEPKGDSAYLERITSNAPSFVTFHPSVPHYETPVLYATHDIFVNLTPEGSMDKTVLEAAACGALVLVSNSSFKDLIPDMCLLKGDSAFQIAEQLTTLANIDETEKDTYREQLQTMVQEKHSLKKLMEELMVDFSGI